MSQSETIVRRADAPKVTASSFAPDSPNQETFLNDLKLNMTLAEPAQGNVYFTGYIFSNENNYNTIADLARTWQNTPTGQAKYTAQQKLTQALDEMLDSGDAELVIPKDSRTVGGSASVNDKTASYTFVPDGNGFTLTPDHAKQYLLPAVRVMPTTAGQRRTGSTSSSRIPKRHSCRPSRWTPPWTNRNARLAMPLTRRKSTCTTTPSLPSSAVRPRWSCAALRSEWTAVNKYTQADGTVRNLTDRYSFKVTPLDGNKTPYSITVTTYDRDETDDNGIVTHKRGEIKTVTKTIGDKQPTSPRPTT